MKVSSEDTTHIPGGPDWLVLGDFNAHHEWWDNIVPRDHRGEWLVDWVEAKRMTILNEGDITRVERGTGRSSTPDLSVCPEDKVDLCRWQVHRALGSDHFPVVIDVGVQSVPCQEKKTMVWNWKGADWRRFQDTIRRWLP